MSNEWSGSPGAQMITNLEAQQRPAWLWDGDGQELIWRNDAARLFLVKKKRHKLHLAKHAVPIKGQIRRLLRLSSTGLTSLARVRFLVGSKPISATCSCTPVKLENGQTGLMIVGVDAIKPKLFRIFAKQNSQPASFDDKTPMIDTPDEAPPGERKGQLSRLVERLAHESEIFDPLGNKDTEENDARAFSVDNGLAQDIPDPQWRVTGRGFEKFDDNSVQLEVPQVSHETAQQNSFSDADTDTDTDTDTDELNPKQVDRIAKYNFEELARVLGSKVGKREASLENLAANQKSLTREQDQTPAPDGKLPERRKGTERRFDSKTINLSEEVLVLNRLPVGILIFRDQNILFANRAMADLLGNSSISDLKSKGLAAIFPRIDNQDTSVGPILSVIGSHGEEVNVDARLQGITWQENSALMLSAQAKPADQAKPAAQAKAVAHAKAGDNKDQSNSIAIVQSIAEARNDGYFEVSRNGILSKISKRGAQLIGQSAKDIIDQPLVKYLHPDAHDSFRNFLEGKAQSAESLLPHIELESIAGNFIFEVFTRGRAGIATGYFGSIHSVAEPSTTSTDKPMHSQAALLLLGRLSRGVRRPLNTVLGFSELIGSQAFGEIQNKRYVEYARDIETAGNEIAQLTDELDEYARLENDDIALEHHSFDLAHLLDECMGLVRSVANRRQVFVRSAISENLPNILADRASMRQAILNLLASAIAQTPNGGKVILSAQIEDDGALGVHVRDSSSGPTGVDDRFVVFREKDTRGGETMVAMKSSMGLALTRSLISVNSCELHVDPSAGTGTLMSLVIPVRLLADKTEL